MALATGQTGSMRRLEQGFALVGLLFMVGALMPLFSSTGDMRRLHSNVQMVTDGTLGFQVLSAGIYLLAAIALLPRYQDVIALLARNKTLTLFVGLILISALWSDLPAVTLRRSLALAGTTVFALYLALRFSPRELLNLLALALALTAVESILLVYFMPEIAINWRATNNYGAWHGGFGHKNIMGRTMVLTMVVLWIVAPQVRTFRPLLWGTFALAFFLMAMSQSRTSWIAAVCLVLAVPFLNYVRRSQIPMLVRIVLVAVIALGGVAILVIEYAEFGLEFLGRDATFSGRTNIWAAAIAVGADQPWLGSGYRTFWTRGLTNYLLKGNGHNSFLDLWLELGFVGLGVFIATLVVATRRALTRLNQSTDRRGIWYPLFLLFLVLFGLAAQVFPDHGTIAWVLYVTTVLYLTPIAVDTRLAVAYRPRETPAMASPAPAE